LAKAATGADFAQSILSSFAGGNALVSQVVQRGKCHHLHVGSISTPIGSLVTLFMDTTRISETSHTYLLRCEFFEIYDGLEVLGCLVVTVAFAAK
jgi:hypothetical protein